MFDVFKWAASAKGVKSSQIKAFGAKIKVDGLPTSHTVEGLEQLLLEQATIPTVTLPKAEVNSNVQTTGKIDAEDISTVIALVRGQMPGEEAKRDKKKAKTVATEAEPQA